MCRGDGQEGVGMDEVIREDHRLESSHEHEHHYQHQHQHDYSVHAVLGCASTSGLELEEGRGDDRGEAAQPASALVPVPPRQQEYQPEQRGQGPRSGGGGPITGRIALTTAAGLAAADQRMRLGSDSSYSTSTDSSMSMDLSLALPPIESPRGSLPPVKGPPVLSARVVGVEVHTE